MTLALPPTEACSACATRAERLLLSRHTYEVDSVAPYAYISDASTHAPCPDQGMRSQLTVSASVFDERIFYH